MEKPLPQIVYVGDRPRLLVDGKPFLILGLQWDCDGCFSPEEMNPLFPHAARMGANTAALPVYWREVEPHPGQFDFRMLDERIRQARANNLRIVLLWFATWKNACAFYAPEYIRSDPATYRPAVDRNGKRLIGLCPTSRVTWERDRGALVAMMEHLRTADPDRVVIMVQVENEAGLLGTDRCYCPACNEAFAAGPWSAQYGPHAGEAFAVVSLARYIDDLAGAARAVYPLPMYVNVWLAPKVGAIPGEYPSGGPIGPVLELFREQCRHTALIAPDIYGSGYRDFQRFCSIYSARRNPLYVAEHSSCVGGRAERNVFYAIGQFGAIGFDPWAISSPFPHRDTPPLVDPVGGEWGPQACLLRDSYVAIGWAIHPIVEAQGTGRIFTAVQEAMEHGDGWEADGCDVLVSYSTREGDGRALLVQLSAREFLIIGMGVSVRFRRPRPDGRAVPVRSADCGRYEGDQWKTLHPMRREHDESAGAPVTLLEPGVARVWLAE